MIFRRSARRWSAACCMRAWLQAVRSTRPLRRADPAWRSSGSVVSESVEARRQRGWGWALLSSSPLEEEGEEEEEEEGEEEEEDGPLCCCCCCCSE